MAEFVHPFKGAKLAWDIQDHINSGYSRYPGEDNIVGPGRVILAPMTGRLTRPVRMPGESHYVRIVAPDGTVCIVREIGSFLGDSNVTVYAGVTSIGLTSRKYPHLEAWETADAVSYNEISRRRPQDNKENEDMFRLVHIGGAAWIVGPTGIRTQIDGSGGNAHLKILARFLASSNAADPMTMAELDTVAMYQKIVAPSVGVSDIDYAKLTAKVLDGMADRLQN